MANNSNSLKIKKMVYLAVLTALVIVLQYAGGFIRLGMFSISAVLVPIVIGSALCGTLSGAWLGFVFGVAVLLSGDATAFLTIDPLGTVITVLLKGALCGLAAGAVYKLFENKNRYLAVMLSSVICPLVNTGVFLAGCALFFWDTVSAWAQSTVIVEVIFYLIGFNFLFEMLLNIILAPVILRLVNMKKA